MCGPSVYARASRAAADEAAGLSAWTRTRPKSCRNRASIGARSVGSRGSPGERTTCSIAARTGRAAGTTCMKACVLLKARSYRVVRLALAIGRWRRRVPRSGCARERPQDERRSRLLPEVEVVREAAEDRQRLAHVRPRVRAPIRLRVEALTAEEVVLDEFRVGVEAEDLVVDVAPSRVRA